MKYKVGDKVRIKTWKNLAEEFNCSSAYQTIPCPFGYNRSMEEDVQDLETDRVLTIKKVTGNDSYSMEKINWTWSDEMIKELVEYHYTILDPVERRFELIDFEE